MKEKIGFFSVGMVYAKWVMLWEVCGGEEQPESDVTKLNEDFDISFKSKPGGVDLKKIQKYIGNTEADEENAVLKAEQDAQIGKGTRGDVTILPTLVINKRQYRGKLAKGAVLKAICSGFQETTEPTVCLSEGIETNECLERNGGCWQDKASNLTACMHGIPRRKCMPLDNQGESANHVSRGDI